LHKLGGVSAYPVDGISSSIQSGRIQAWPHLVLTEAREVAVWRETLFAIKTLGPSR
jgi:hypothetical protein